MLHEKAVKYGPAGDDADETNTAWTGEKRRRKYLQQSSSSDAPTVVTAQDPIPLALFGTGEAAKDHRGPISDVFIVQEQDHALRPRKHSEGGGEEEETQELFGPLVEISEEDQDYYANQLPPDVSPPDSMTPQMSWTEKFKVLPRLARHRVAYYKIVKPQSECKLKDPDEYSEYELREEEYFEYLENDFDWFFHTDDISNPDLDDYQKIALKNILPYSIQPEYLDVSEYQGCHHTYEMDAVYVKYYGELSKKIKWIDSFLHLDRRSGQWRIIETRGWRQALRLAVFFHVTIRLARFAYKEYISELRNDAVLKDLDLVYFEIWRLVVKDKKEYKEALELVLAMEKFHMHKHTVQAELEGTPVFWTIKQRIYGIILESEITANAEDDKVLDMFRKGVARLKTKNMVKYAEKKMEIADRLNLRKRIEVLGQIGVP